MGPMNIVLNAAPSTQMTGPKILACPPQFNTSSFFVPENLEDSVNEDAERERERERERTRLKTKANKRVGAELMLFIVVVNVVDVREGP